MNIALISQGFPPYNTDGVPRYNHALAIQLSLQGHQVKVFMRDPQRQINQPNGFEIVTHQPQSLSQNISGLAIVDQILAGSKSVYNSVLSHHKKTTFDVIATPLWDVEGYMLAKNKIAPIITTLVSPFKKVYASNPQICAAREAGVIYQLERELILNSDGIMSISRSIQSTISDLYEIDFESLEIDTIPIGLEPEFIPELQTQSSSKQLKILYVGRLEKRKGIDVLLKALPKLLNKYSSISVDIVGKLGYMEPDYETVFAQQYGNREWVKKVRFHGYVSDQNLKQFYQECDIFIIPSRYESFGITTLEAMAYKTAVVGSNVGGIKDTIIDRSTGLHFEPGNTEDLTVKVSDLIDNQELRTKLAKNARAKVESSYTAETMATKFMALCKKIVIPEIKATRIQAIPYKKQTSDLERWNLEARTMPIRVFNYSRQVLGSINFLHPIWDRFKYLIS